MTFLQRHSSSIKSMPIVVTTLMLLCAAASSSWAHSLYIQSTRYVVEKGRSLPLFFCYGHYVPVADGIRAKKLGKVEVIAPGGAITPIQVRNETGLHSYMVKYDTPGTWTLAAATTPGYYTIYTDKNGKERHVIKPISAVKDQAKEIHKSYYVKQYAKTYVNCGASSDIFPASAGLALELLPVKDLFTLKPGENLELDVHLDGNPYTGEGTWDATYLGYSTVAEDNFYPKTKVRGSRLSIPIPNTGRWFIRYFIKKDAPEVDKDKYWQMKLTATLTFQIDNERKTPKSKAH